MDHAATDATDLDAERLRHDLLAFWDRRRRDLPWRGERDPYRILVSEVMLQQTRVETVLGYYGRWLERFPDLEALAAADEADVLKAWEGLGYYRRARNLHAAARVVRERHGGRLPATAGALRALPGVGDYTSGAVASIAFGEAVPAVDGNVRRVLARLLDRAEPTPAWLRDTASALVDPARPGEWNQALMELGQAVCTPARPACGECPVAWSCGARAAGTVEVRPGPVRKAAPRPALMALAVLRRRADGAILLVRRPEGGLLGGLWALPEREVETEEDGAEAVLALAGGATAARPLEARPLPPVRHRFTHLYVTYLPWLVTADGPVEGALAEESRWTTADVRGRLALPVAQRRVLDSVVAVRHSGGGNVGVARPVS